MILIVGDVISVVGQIAVLVCQLAQAEGGGVLIIMHGRSRMTIDPRIPTMPGRSASSFHRLGRVA